MKISDVERSFIDVVSVGVGSSSSVDVPSRHFDRQTIGEWWVEPRVSGYDVPGNSKAGFETDAFEFTIRCFVKSQPKGGRHTRLSSLVDIVRAVVDPSEGAPPIKVLDTAGDVVGFANVVTANISFSWDVAETFNSGQIEGLDIAVITLAGTLSRSIGGC